jgi:hypothetical protein
MGLGRKDIKKLIDAGVKPHIAKKIDQFYFNGKAMSLEEARVAIYKGLMRANPPGSIEEAKIRKDIAEKMIEAHPELKVEA